MLLTRLKPRKCKSFETSAQVDDAIAELKAYWEELLSIYTVNTNEDKLNRMVNIWNPYNVWLHLICQSASYFESGIGRGMGFRDSNQDLLGLYIRFRTEQGKNHRHSLDII